MTVLWIDLVSELGGAQNSLYEAVTNLSKKGVQVVVAVPYGPLFDRLTAAGIKVFPVSAVRARKHGWGLFVTAAKLLQVPSTVLQIIRAVKPDIIHANSLPALLAANRVASHIPIVWHVRDLKLPPAVVHNAAPKTARIIAVSATVDEHLVDILSPRIIGRIRVIRNGIDTARFAHGNKEALRDRFGLPSAVPIVGMIAHLTPWKRHDAFIDAASMIHPQCPDAHFVIVGRDLFHEHTRWISQLEAKIDQAGLTDHFHWVKDVNDAEAILPAFDVLLHPALQEPFGRVICEAQAAGVPVVAAESGGVTELIQSGITGILVPEGAPQLFATETLALLADPARASNLATAARAYVQEHHTTERVCDQLLQEYRAILSSIRPHDDDE